MAGGKKLGGLRLAEARWALYCSLQQDPDAFAANVRPIIEEFRRAALAAYAASRRNGPRHPNRSWWYWSDVQVAAVLRR